MSKSSKKSDQKLKQSSEIQKWTVLYNNAGQIIQALPFTQSEERTSIEVNEDPQIMNQYGVVIKCMVDGALVDRPTKDVEEETVSVMRSQLRLMRDKRLSMTDFTQSPDSPLSEEQKSEWAEYRQALRDLPSNIEDSTNLTWPVAPANPAIKGVNNA